MGRRKPLVGALLVGLSLAACSSSPAETPKSPGSPPAFSALSTCQEAVASGATVTAAYPTTVEQVRLRRHPGGGTPPVQGKSPVEGLTDWAGLAADLPAAWCGIKANDHAYEVTAVAAGARMVTFATSDQPMDPGPNGPSMP